MLIQESRTCFDIIEGSTLVTEKPYLNQPPTELKHAQIKDWMF